MVKNERERPEKEGKNMALLARPNDKLLKIDKNKSKKFLEDSKKNIIRPEFLKRCQEYSRIINKGNK